MADRRRSPRYVFFAPLDARVQVVQEAVVENWERDRVTVLTTAAAARGDDLIIRFRSRSEQKSITARVIASAPAPDADGTFRYRLILSPKPGAATWGRNFIPIAGAIQQLTVDAVVMKTVAAQVRNLSAIGCSLEMRTHLPVGAVGKLYMKLDGKRRIEWFRICRIQLLHGRSGVHAIGAEFLPLAAAGDNALRSAIWRLRMPTVAIQG